MNCSICHQEITDFMGVSVNDGKVEVKVHFECFFKDIPDPPSISDENNEEKALQRKKLMEKRSAEILKAVRDHEK